MPTNESNRTDFLLQMFNKPDERNDYTTVESKNKEIPEKVLYRLNPFSSQPSSISTSIPIPIPLSSPPASRAHMHAIVFVFV
jgi:hypothetical protein